MLMWNRSYLLGGVALLLPFVVWPGTFFDDPLRSPKLIALFLVGLFVGVDYIYRHISHALAWNVLWCGISASISGLGYGMQLANMAFIGAGVLVSSKCVGLDKKEFDTFLKFIIIASVGNGVISYFQIFQWDYIYVYKLNADATIPTGFLGHQTLLGPLLVSGVIASLFTRRYFLAAFLIYPVFKTASTLSYLSLFTGVSVYSTFQFGIKKYLLAVTTAVLIFSAFSTKSYRYDLMNANGRYSVWEGVLNKAKDHYIIGHGFGTYPFYSRSVQSELSIKENGLFNQVHNDYLEHFFETGLIGILLLLYMFFTLIRSTWEFKNEEHIVASFAIILSYMADAVGNFPLRILPMGLFALMFYVAVTTYKGEKCLIQTTSSL